jgi:hypothetical protein
VVYERIASRLMTMTDEVWMRHANPLSGWTRLWTFPVLFVAIWSYVWIGWWALVPGGVLAAWTWLNPRIFTRVQSDAAWVTRGVFGERIFLRRKQTPIPAHHERVAHVLTALSAVALVGAIVGFVWQDFWLALGGWVLAAVFKIWFVDRMAWLYADMRDATAEYRGWREGRG